MKVDFFISRAGPDAEWAQWIADSLVAAGYTVVLQDWDFRPGQDFVAEMDRAMRDSSRTIAVLSRSYERALFTVPEWTHAVARDPTGHQALLVPVKVDDIVPEGIFKTRVFIDLVGLDENQARQELLRGVRLAVARDGSSPFPGGVTARFPGALPPVWRLPSDRNPVFTGREQNLAQIAARFESNDPPPLVAALVGLDGIGKTALAVEYAYRYRQIYKVVWWVRAERQETVIADLALLADELHLAAEDDSLSTRAAAAREWLSSHDQWLLVVDDATATSVVQQAIPQGGAGHVLLTSHLPAWRRYATVMELGLLPDESAVELLAKRSGQKPDAASASLVQALGALPLAVELAGAFLEQQGIGPTEYLERLRGAGGLPMDDPAYRPPDAAHGFRAVWAESFRVLAKETPLATQLLRLAAFLAPDDIPRPALTRGAHSLPWTLGPTAADSDALADLVARPRSLSLVTTSGDGFSMHRLVQAIIRDGLENTEKKSWAGTAVLLLDHVLPRQVTDFRLWNLAGRLVGHALTAADHGVDESVEPTATIRLLDRGATFLAETGGNAQDIAARRGAALRLGQGLADGPPGWLLNNHALWLVEQGATDEAEPLLEQALQATRRVEGGGAPAVGTMWVNLGSLAKRGGRLDRARTCLERGLAILDRLPAWAESQRATAHSLMGQVLFEQGDRDAAAAHFTAAVRGYDEAFGPGSLDSVLARTFLAQARGEDPSRVITVQQISRSSIQAEEGRLLSAEPAWVDEAERLLRGAYESGEPGAAVELASLLRSLPGKEAEGDAILTNAAANGDREALYWHARDLGGQTGIAAEPVIRHSIEAGNVFSWYDLGLVLTAQEARWPEAEAAFRAALSAGFEEARNDLGLLLLGWPGRQGEGEAQLAEAGRRAQGRSWFNLGQYLWDQPDRKEEAVEPLLLAANAGYLQAHGTLAYRLEDLGRLNEALAAFKAGVEAGDVNLSSHMVNFLKRHPELNDEGDDRSQPGGALSNR